MGRMPHVYLIRHGEPAPIPCELETFTDFFFLQTLGMDAAGQTEWSVNGE